MNPSDLKENYPDAYNLYRYLKVSLNPRIPKVKEEMMMYLLDFHNTEANFLGGAGDKRMTLHENIFHWLYGYLSPQVTFGTGKNGVELWGCRKFIADFYDSKDQKIYEIDGSSHKSFKARLKDFDRQMFFNGQEINVVRFTNKQVEQMLIDRLIELEKEGLFSTNQAM